MTLLELVDRVDLYTDVEVSEYRPNRPERIIYSGNGVDMKKLLNARMNYFKVLHLFIYKNVTRIYVEVI